ncbi:PHD finger protein 6-like [Saccoglossus kowalevskii]
MTGDMTTERRCDFCHTEDDNLGELYVHGKYAAHYKCMLYSSGLYQVDESEQDDTFDDFGGGFATGLVIKEIKRGKRLVIIILKPFLYMCITI